MQKKYLLLTASALLIGAGLWHIITSSSDGPKLSEHDATAAHPNERDGARQHASETSPRTDLTSRRGRESKGASDRLGQLEAFADNLKDKIVVDLGTAEDIGKQTSAMLGTRQELMRLRSIKPENRTLEENQRLLELERQNAIAMGVLPEITSFQNDPIQYANFFSSLIQEAAGLDQNQRNIVYDYMNGRGEGLIAAGLNAAREPVDPSEEALWEERRDQFNTDTAAGIAKILGPGEAERIGFTPGFLELLEQDFDKADGEP